MKAFFQAILLALLAAGVGLAYNQFADETKLAMPWDSTTASTETDADADTDADAGDDTDADASDADEDTDAGKKESDDEDADAKDGAKASGSSDKSNTTAAKTSGGDKDGKDKDASSSFDPSGIVTTKPGGKTPSLRSGLTASSSKETAKPGSDKPAKATGAKGTKPAADKGSAKTKKPGDKPKGTAATQTPAKKDKPGTAKPTSKPAAAAKAGKEHVAPDQGHEAGRIAKENDIKCLSYAGMKKRVEDEDQAWIVIDARPTDDFAEGHIPRAINIPFREANKKAMLNRLADFGVNAGSPVVIYCSGQTCEKASEMAAWLLVEEQYIDVEVYIEGYDIWKARKEAE